MKLKRRAAKIASNADIGSRAGCELLVQQCVDAFGGIDIAINNAGIVRDKTLLKLKTRILILCGAYM